MDQANTLVKLREGISDTLIIFIHPIGGTLFTYKSLISHLVTSSPIYGIQDNFAVGQFKEYKTLVEQAAYYIKNIFGTLNPSNIIFAGHSSGGTLAFEMSRQCVEYGVTVENIFLFDTWAEIPFSQEFNKYFQKIILRQLDKINSVHSLSDEVRTMWLDKLWQRMHLLFSYVPKPAPVSGILFIATENVEEYTVNRNSHYDWNKFLKDCNRITVSGNHETLLDAEYIIELSMHINKFLKNG